MGYNNVKGVNSYEKRYYREFNKMEEFYQKLANPMMRKERLFANYNNSIPHIEAFRKLSGR